jgi:hypothetical protein
LPHAPQFALSLWVFTSQPSLTTLLQSANPLLQLPIAHAPALQARVALASGGQTLPHALQLSGSPFTFLQALPQHESPVPQPEMPHAPAHTPPLHVEPGAQTLPQLPQFALSVLVSTSQPSAKRPLQLAKPSEHAATVHLAAPQVPVPFGGLVQSMPQPPQFFGSWSVSSQLVPQQVRLEPQLAPPPQPPTQVPPEQLSPVAHARPHAPQFAGSPLRLTSQPSAATRSQSAKPRTQLPMPQVLALQPATAFASGGQVKPQPPQLVGSPVVSRQRSAQQRSDPGQLPSMPHAPTQALFTQVWPLGHSLLVMHCTHS